MLRYVDVESADRPFDTALLAYPDVHRLPRSHKDISRLQVWSVAKAFCLSGTLDFYKSHY